MDFRYFADESREAARPEECCNSSAKRIEI